MNLTPETWRRVAEVVADRLRPGWTAAEAVAIERFLADAADHVGRAAAAPTFALRATAGRLGSLPAGAGPPSGHPKVHAKLIK